MSRVIGAGGGCFPAGTQVMTPAGETPIESLRPGDEVVSFDASGRVSVSVVQKLHVHDEDQVLRMDYWGGSLRVTSNHWVLNQYNTFALAGTLTEHDALVDSLGHLRPVLRTTKEGTEPVYNLTVVPDHTFVADNIRVHNGGRGLTRPIVGSGGGGDGKGGGGGHTPTEDPDSLQSHQYARVIDLISEGEIGGLVNGLASVYLDDTPVMNADGSMNFSGVALDWRNGTPDQSVIDGFAEVENETVVGVRVTAVTPIVRSVINTSVDAARVTVAVPQLTNQDTSNGDLHGTSVQIAIDVQSNGGGYVQQAIGRTSTPVAAVGNQVDVVGADGAGLSFTAKFPTTSVLGQTKYLPLTWRVEYRAPGSGVWTLLVRETAAPSAAPAVSTGGGFTGLITSAFAALTQMSTLTRSYSTPQSVNGDWGIRVVLESAGTITSVTGSHLTLVMTDTISGKTTSRYKRSYYLPLTGTGPWDIRVRRLTDDSTASNLQNQTWWDSIAEIVESKLSYPHSAVIAASIDAAQFQNIPRRGYEIYGIKVQIPSNYDPVARTYTGTWDGTFVVAWSNNPAWIYYDLCTNERYGLGAFIDASLIDKWALYDIGKYCDETVPSGYGYLEPRYTCNTYIQTRDDAYKLLLNMASVFRGMAYWSAGQVAVTADMPSDAISIFSPANVIDGVFTYSGSSRQTRYTVALVTWNDPLDMYRQKVEYVEDIEGIARYGINQSEVVAFGCTSRGQAHRLGRWLLYTSRLETETVGFKTGLEGTTIYPGAIIKIADTARSGDRIGGRILGSAISSVTLDAPVTLLTGVVYTLTVMLPDGSVEDRTVTSAAGTRTTLTVSPNFSAVPQLQAMWVLASVNLEPQVFRVIGVTESGKTEVEVTALAHDPNKYAMIEMDQQFDPPVISTTRAVAPAAPINLVASDTLYLAGPGTVGAKVHFSWEGQGTRFEVRWKQGSNNYEAVAVVTNSADILSVITGAITLGVRALDALGRTSPWANLDYTVLGASSALPVVQNLISVFRAGLTALAWDAVTDPIRAIEYEVRKGASWGTAQVLGRTTGLDFVADGDGTYWVSAHSDQAYSSSPTSIVVAGASIVKNVVATYDELATGWSGTVSGSAVLWGNSIVLGGAGMFSAIPTVSAQPTIAYYGGVATTGIYTIPVSHEIDIGTVQGCNCSVSYVARADNPFQLFSALPSVAAAASIAGNYSGLAGVTIQIATSDASGTYGSWKDFVPGMYYGRKFKFRAVLNSTDPSVIAALDSFTYTVDMPDRVDKGTAVSVSAGGMSVTYAVPFQVAPNVQITILGATQGDDAVLTSQTANGFTVQVLNGGVGVARTINWIAQGY